MASTVWYWNMRASMKAPYETRMRKLLGAAGLAEQVAAGDLTALKIHFGERGTTAFISPVWVRPITDFLRQAGAKPFLTDANTLYVGSRGEAVSHSMQAAEHGFDPLLLGAPVIIADGLRGETQTAIPYTGKHFKETYFGTEIVKADSLVFLTHFKGHELAGFGGALKNVGMGCASRQGKMQQHACTGPATDLDKCKGCGACVEVCAAGALVVEKGPEKSKDGKRVSFNRDKCVGCAACFLACRHGCLNIDWKTNVAEFLERMMEYTAALLLTRKKPSLFLNFVMDVTPDCDCIGFSDAPLCPNIGVLASWDPVALDQACLDMVTAAPASYPSKLPQGAGAGTNKFAAVHPHVPQTYGLDYAEKIGLGSREYVLTSI